MLNQPSLLHSVSVTMFHAAGLFKEVICPEQPRCMLPNCIFSHNSIPLQSSYEECSNGAHPERSSGLPEAPRKRRRLDHADQQPPLSRDRTDSNIVHRFSPPATASRSISPPPRRTFNTTNHSAGSPFSLPQPDRSVQAAAPKPAVISLNPPLLANSPAPHAIRVQLVKMLHEQFLRLNQLVEKAEDTSVAKLKLSHDDLVLQALSEEEKVIKENPAVYTNLVKLRIVKLRKMQLQEWMEERYQSLGRKGPTMETEVIKTGLSAKQELAFLPKLLAKLEGLERYGYVTLKPSEADIEKAKKGLDAAQSWEQCDRCSTRFQIFPGRRSNDGALTSGGSCTYHSAKARRPVITDGNRLASRDSIYSCCKETVGTSVGCTKSPSHVFKVTNAARLDIITPFQETPVLHSQSRHFEAICFDCEMGYTTKGLELIRLTATSWPSGEEVVDVLVRPCGEVLDLNSKYSGVWPKDFADAVPYSANSNLSPPSLQIVESPMAARELLFAHLLPSTPLIGHALDNDLNAARIIHPSIIDTVLLYPHPRGLPIRYGLKMLMKKHLDRDIQVGDGSTGHDSKEDARAAGDLVRLKLRDIWSKMQRDGWVVEGEEFTPPMTRAEAIRAEIAKVRK